MTNRKKRTWSFKELDYSALPPCGYVFSVQGVSYVGYPTDLKCTGGQDLRDLIKAASRISQHEKFDGDIQDTDGSSAEEIGGGS